MYVSSIHMHFSLLVHPYRHAKRAGNPILMPTGPRAPDGCTAYKFRLITFQLEGTSHISEPL
jgi:hypothetical protein